MLGQDSRGRTEQPSKKLALRFQDARIGSQHLAVFFGHESVSLFRAGKHFIAILKRHEPGAGVPIRGSGGAITKSENDAQLFKISAFERSGRGGDISLIAIED